MGRHLAESDVLLAPPGPLDRWEAPRIRVSTDGWSREQKVGDVSLAPEAIWDLDLPADQSVTFEWSARPKSRASSPPRCDTCPKGEITGYRWALDIEDLTDETPRDDEDTDLAHWSTWSLDVISTTIGPFEVGDEHVLSVEARDSKGFLSLVTLRLHFVEEVNAELARR